MFFKSSFGLSLFCKVILVFIFTKNSTGQLDIMDECGGELEQLELLLRSPNYPTQDFPTRKYQPNLDCYWTREARLDTLTMLKLWDISIEPGRNGDNSSCEYDYLNISIQSLGWDLYCGHFVPAEPLRGFGTLKLHFHSDDSVTFRGFQATYQMVEDFSSCEPNPCNKGTCEMMRGEIYPTCLCGPGTSGEYCEIDLPECLSNPCLNGGVCDDSIEVNHYKCNCPLQWEGVNCESAKQDPCLDLPCLHGGSCLSNEDFTFTCKCNPGYTGDICDAKTGCGNPGIPYLHEHRRFDKETTLEYSCVENYILIGANQTTCYENGSWSNAMPQCKKNVTGDETQANDVTPYAGVMIGLGATLVVNTTVFVTYMIYKSPWSILEKLRSAFTSQPAALTPQPQTMTPQLSDVASQLNSAVEVSVTDDSVFERERD